MAAGRAVSGGWHLASFGTYGEKPARGSGAVVVVCCVEVCKVELLVDLASAKPPFDCERPLVVIAITATSTITASAAKTISNGRDPTPDRAAARPESEESARANRADALEAA